MTVLHVYRFNIERVREFHKKLRRANCPYYLEEHSIQIMTTIPSSSHQCSSDLLQMHVVIQMRQSPKR